MATTPNSTYRPEIAMPPLHAGQMEVAQSEARFKVVRCGRQFGKTNYGAIMTVKTALEGGRAWWCAPTYDNAKEGYAVITDLCLQIKKRLPAGAVEWRKTDREFHFAGGGSVAMHTLSEPDNLRGPNLNLIVVDEAAYLPSDYAWRRVLRPMLMRRRGEAVFISTPNGRNWFYNLYHLGDPTSEALTPGWESFHFTSYDNPWISREELDEIKATEPDLIWQEEYLAEFLDDRSSVFKNIKEASIAGEASPAAGHSYIIGVDLAKKNDYTVFSVFDVNERRQTFLQRINGVNYTEQVQVLAGIAGRYNNATCVVEENGMEAVMEMLDKTGVRYTRFHTNNASKEAIVRRGQVAFEQWGKEEQERDETLRVTLLHRDENTDAKQQSVEMRAFEMKKVGDSGRFSYRAPYGQHDDIVMANLLAIDGMTDRRGQPLTVDTYNWYGR